MSLVEIFDTVTATIGGTPLKRARVTITLLGTPLGYVPGAQNTIYSKSEVQTDNAGNYSVELVPNSEISPAGTVYLLLYEGFNGELSKRQAITVPASGGPYWVGDIRTPIPGPPGPFPPVVGVPTDGQVPTFVAANGDVEWRDGATGGGAVDSVNDQTGVVVLTAGDVGADTSGAAAAAQTASEGFATAAVAAEATLRSAGDATNATAISAETSRAQAAEAGLIPLTQKAAASGVATLDSSGLIPAVQLPALVLSHTFVVSSQAAMLGLSAANTGDLAVRTDINETFILSGADPTILSNWTQLLSPGSAVSSVNARTGAVVGLAEAATTISAGTGLTGGGDLSMNRTLSMPNVGTAGTYGDATHVGQIVTDAQGRVSGANAVAISGLAQSAITNLTSDLAAKSSITQITGLFGNHSGWALGTDTDVYLPAASWSAGVLSGGIVKQATGLRLSATYTQTAEPADIFTGSPLVIDWNPTLNDTNAPFGPTAATGLYGPRALVNIEGITQVGADQNTFAFTPIGFGDMHRVKNVVGSNRRIVPGWVIMSARTTYADTNTVTLGGNDIANGTAGFVEAQTFATANSGTLDGTTASYEIISFLSMPAVYGNTHISTRTGFKVNDLNQYLGVPGTVGNLAPYIPNMDVIVGAVDTQYGIYIPNLTQATRNIGILNGSATVNPTRAVSITAAGTTLPIDATVIAVTASSALTLTSTPTIPAGLDGQHLRIVNVGTNPLTLQDDGTLAGSTLLISGVLGSVALAQNQSIELMYSSAASKWVKVERSSPLSTLGGKVIFGDGNAAHGMVAIDAQAFGQTVNAYANTADTGPVAIFGHTLSGTGMLLGPGGAASADFSILRTGTAAAAVTGTLTMSAPVITGAASFTGIPAFSGGEVDVTDGTASHGQVTLKVGAIGPALQLFGNTADAAARVALGATGLSIGPGGAAATDVSLLRTGVAAAAFTGVLTVSSPVINTGVSGSAIDPDATFAANSDTILPTQKAVKTATALLAPIASPVFTGSAKVTISGTNTFTVDDGTAAHGQITSSAGGFGPLMAFWGSTADTKAKISISTLSGIQLGPGGTTSTDVTFARTGTAAASFSAGTITFALPPVLTGASIVDANNIVLGTTTGTKIGTATTQKLAFWNATPVIQPAAAAQALVGSSPPATGDTGITAGAFASAAHRDALVTCVSDIKTLVNQIRNDLVAVGIEKGSA